MEQMTKEQRELAAAFVRQCAANLDNEFNRIADELDVIRECASSIALTLIGDGSCFDSGIIDGNLARALNAISQLIRAAGALDPRARGERTRGSGSGARGYLIEWKKGRGARGARPSPNAKTKGL